MHDTLNAALAKWLEVLDYDQDAQNAMNIRQMDAHLTIKELNEAQELDNTGLTTAMLLMQLWETYANTVVCSIKELVEENEAALNKIAQYKQLRTLLESPEIVEPASVFTDKTVESLRHYGAEHAVEMACNKCALGLLRRDSLRSLKTLDTFQFVQGTPTTSKLRYNPLVYRFPNMQSLISATIGHEPGVSLCHILDQDGQAFSYFAFSVWNGGTLTVVTDKPEWAHPGQKLMMRCPGREFSERWGRHHFPYELLGAQFSDSGKHVNFVPTTTGLVRYDIKATAVTKVWSLEPDVVIWLSLMFDLLQERYFVNNPLLEDLSYTGDMCQGQVAVEYPIMKLDGWKPPIKPTFQTSDLTAESTASNWGRESAGNNRWLEERYRDKVPSDLLNLVKDDKDRLLPPPGTSDTASQLYADASDKLVALAPTDFGTEKQLRDNFEWSARYNQAVIVDKLAKDEFEDTKAEVLKWYADRLAANREFLIDAAARMSLECDIYQHRRGGWFDDSRHIERANILRIQYDESGNCEFPHTDYDFSWFSKNQTIGTCNLVNRRYHWYCAVEPLRKASITAGIVVRDPLSIACVTATPLDQLPVPLQNYFKDELYSGNQILERIDPMEWVVQNPWVKLDLNVKVVLSKTSFNKRRKALGLPHFSDWDSIARRKG